MLTQLFWTYLVTQVMSYSFCEVLALLNQFSIPCLDGNPCTYFIIMSTCGLIENRPRVLGVQSSVFVKHELGVHFVPAWIQRLQNLVVSVYLKHKPIALVLTC